MSDKIIEAFKATLTAEVLAHRNEESAGQTANFVKRCGEHRDRYLKKAGDDSALTASINAIANGTIAAAKERGVHIREVPL